MEGIPLPNSLREEAAFMSVCASNGSLKCHGVLILRYTTPSCDILTLRFRPLYSSIRWVDGLVDGRRTDGGWMDGYGGRFFLFGAVHFCHLKARALSKAEVDLQPFSSTPHLKNIHD